MSPANQVQAEKMKRTAELRAEYIRQITNPHRHATGEGGAIFDSGLARFQAMRVNQYEHFKPTVRSFKVGFFTVVFPIVAYAMWMKSDRDAKEKMYRTGQVAYKDRRFKFI